MRRWVALLTLNAALVISVQGQDCCTKVEAFVGYSYFNASPKTDRIPPNPIFNPSVFGGRIGGQPENSERRVARRQHQPVVLGDQQVFQHRHAGKQPDVLEGAGNARLLGDEEIRHALELVERAALKRDAARAAIGERFQRAPCRRVTMAQAEAAFARFVETGDAIEHRGFASAVRSDQRGDIALLRLERQVVNRDQAAEAHGQMLDTKQDVAGVAHQP